MLPDRLARLPVITLHEGATLHEARGFRNRLLGLAFLDEIPAGHALFIPDTRSIHTFGMRFALDVAFLDERARTLRIERGVPRRRVLVCRDAFAVVESRAGEIERFLVR